MIRPGSLLRAERSFITDIHGKRIPEASKRRNKRAKPRRILYTIPGVTQAGYPNPRLGFQEPIHEYFFSGTEMPRKVLRIDTKSPDPAPTQNTSMNINAFITHPSRKADRPAPAQAVPLLITLPHRSGEDESLQLWGI